MKDSLYLAWRYLAHHRAKTALLVLALAMFLGLPIAMRAMSGVIQRSFLVRAEATPLLLGTKGSSLDLVIEALYFEPKAVEALTMADADEVDGTGLASAIPLRTGLMSRTFPVVGTTLDYFDFRGSKIRQGRMLATLGECVVGAEVARALEVEPGDSVTTSPSTMFDLAGVYPLRMRIAGILAPSQSPDDRAVFVDLKTAWIAEGLGHGHQDLTTVRGDVLLKTNSGVPTANAKLVQYNEVTEVNRDSFHFHGDPRAHPVSAIIAVPHDEKSGVLLRGRFVDDAARQLLRPAQVVEALNDQIFRFERVLRLIVSTVGVATGAMFLLVMVLSWRLRADELRTMTRLGCSRFKAAEIMAAEVLLMVSASAMIAATFAFAITQYGETWLQNLILRGS